MTRSRKFKSTRRKPGSERSLFEQKLTQRYSRTLDRTDLLNLIRGGEDTYIEFKIRLVNTDKIISEIVALANAGGGAIVFGVNDQRRLEGLDDPEHVEQQLIDISRNHIVPPLLPRIDKVSFDNGVRIVVLQVDDRRAPHKTPDNRYFIRIGSTKREADGSEIAALFARSRVAAFEDMPLVRAAIEDVDEALVWSYIRDLEGEAFREPEGFPTPAAMRDLRLASDYGMSVTPTLAGFLLFGRSPAIERIVPQSRIVLTRLSGSDDDSPVVERVDYYGNVTRLFDLTLSFIKRYADLWDTRPPRAQSGNGEPVLARANYPREAVIEALTNMLVHRDYSIAGSPSRVSIFDDRMDFINPSHTNGNTRKSVEYGATLQPNPRLHHIFTSLEYGIEHARRGIPALRRAHYTFARREPNISLLSDEFRLQIFGV
ncbi:MAG: putative DNA binding domain-containing protein [Blastocatellia bacterium]|nr:putative DNA binding domain-containing protein [Blastocatellia bacterium]